MTSSELIIRGASVIDGCGAPGRAADVAVDRDHIVAVGDCRDWRAEVPIEAKGLALAPLAPVVALLQESTYDR